MKHYRIARIAPMNYQTPLLALYKENASLHLQPYEEQLATLFQKQYAYGDGFSRAMRSFGHDAHEIVYDVEILQKAWASEHKIAFDSHNWQQEIVYRQIEFLRPDIAYFQGLDFLSLLPPKFLKESFPFIKLVVVYTGFPRLLNELADVDVIFAGIPLIVRQFHEAGLRAQLLYHAFNDTILGAIANTEGTQSRFDFTFVGSSGYGRGLAQQARYWALVELMQRTPLELWVDEVLSVAQQRWRPHSMLRESIRKCLARIDPDRLNVLLKYQWPEKLRRIVLDILNEHRANGIITRAGSVPTKSLGDLFGERCHGPMFGIDMFRILHQSRVTFNKHADAAQNNVGNMRMFEATGMGTCLLTDTGINMPDLFEEDREVVTYTSIDECVEKVHYLLEHEDVRRQIAEAGQKRTLRDHTVLHRCQQINETLQHYKSKRGAWLTQ